MVKITEVKQFLGKKRNVESLIKNSDLNYINNLIDILKTSKDVLEQEKIKQEKKLKEEQEKIQQAKEYLNSMGISLNQLTNPKSKTKKAKKSLKPKYKDDNGNTWAGTGKQPNWIKELINRGESLDKYLVVDN